MLPQMKELDKETADKYKDVHRSGLPSILFSQYVSLSQLDFIPIAICSPINLDKKFTATDFFEVTFKREGLMIYSKDNVPLKKGIYNIHYILVNTFASMEVVEKVRLYDCQKLNERIFNCGFGDRYPDPDLIEGIDDHIYNMYTCRVKVISTETINCDTDSEEGKLLSARWSLAMKTCPS